ncbi:MAG: DNA-binding MarR family transcriptional regulator [Paraglaciecola sp.]|jgi:DNA-binding MarR family transcriptional regulator
MSHNTPAMSLLIKLMSLHAHLLKKIDNNMSAHGISFTEFLVMHYLKDAPGKTMRRIELAESIGLTASGVTRLLMPMEKIGLVTKESNPRDARVSLVKLTAAGNEIFTDAAVSFEHVTTELTGTLSAKQLTEFIKLTDALL